MIYLIRVIKNLKVISSIYKYIFFLCPNLTEECEVIPELSYWAYWNHNSLDEEIKNRKIKIIRGGSFVTSKGININRNNSHLLNQEKKKSVTSKRVVDRIYIYNLSFVIIIFMATSELHSQRFISFWATVLGLTHESLSVQGNRALVLPQAQLLNNLLDVGWSAISMRKGSAVAIRISKASELHNLKNFVIGTR